MITHLSRNADGLVNLLHWAQTGVETTMYVSDEKRDADIAAGAGRSRRGAARGRLRVGRALAPGGERGAQQPAVDPGHAHARVSARSRPARSADSGVPRSRCTMPTC